MNDRVSNFVITLSSEPRWSKKYGNNDSDRLSATVPTRPHVTQSPSSRNSLADVLVRISGADLPSKQRAEMASAVRRVAKALGADPALIPADPAILRRRLEGISHQMVGLSAGRWNNVRSLFGKALALVAPLLPGRSATPLLAAWQDLTNDLDFNRRTRLLPPLRWLSEKGVGPDAVTLQHLDAYRVAIFEDRLRKDPQKAWDSLTWSWNACVRERPLWPQIEIPREQKRQTYTYGWDHYPPSLKQDVDAYLAHLAGTNLSEDGPSRPARQATLETRERQLRMAAAAAVHQGILREELTSLATLLTFERVQVILRFFLNRNAGKPSPQMGYLASFFKTIAKYWLKLSEEELRPYEKLSSRLNQNNRGRGMTRKNRGRLRPFDDPQMVQKFLQLPFRLKEEADKDQKSPIKRRAIKAQLAAAIAILQIMPIRRRNISDIDLEQHLIARGKRLYLVIEGDETKNYEPIDFEFPQETKEIVAWYVREYRPCLVTNGSTALFPGQDGKAKSEVTLSQQIKKLIMDYTGLEFNLHLFRHAGAKFYLDVKPGHYETMRRVLGHRSINTTTATYSGAETKSVGLHFASVVAERRQSSDVPSRLRPPQRTGNKPNKAKDKP